MDLVLLVSLLTQLSLTSGNHYDVRCKCVCPNPGIINLNTTDPTAEERRLYIRNVAPSHCDCLNVVIPSLYVEHHHVARATFCPRCVCRYEQRNTTIIKVVVRDGHDIGKFEIKYSSFKQYFCYKTLNLFSIVASTV